MATGAGNQLNTPAWQASFAAEPCPASPRNGFREDKSRRSRQNHDGWRLVCSNMIAAVSKSVATA